MTTNARETSTSNKHQKKNIWTITRSFRATDTLSHSINQLAEKARKHPGDIMKEAVIRYVKYYQQHPEKLDVTP